MASPGYNSKINDSKPVCKYGSKCYRTNKEHLKQFSHPVDCDGSNEPEAKRPKRQSSLNTGQKISGYFKKEQEKDKPESDQKVTSESDAGVGKKVEQKLRKSFSIPDHKRKSASNTSIKYSSLFHDCECPGDDDDDNVPSVESAIDPRENIKLKYGMQMPDDFYKFWEFCEALNPQKPTEALDRLLGFTLVGPFDIIAKTPQKSLNSQPNFHVHYRYFYDPPEFMTVIKGSETDGFHIGYYRDDPGEMPAYVASNTPSLGCALTLKGDNLFAAVKYFINERLKQDDLPSRVHSDLTELGAKVVSTATELCYCLDLRSGTMKARDKRVVCKTMNGAGLVVPVDDNDVGYRPVPETLADLKKILKRIAESSSPEERDQSFEPLQEIITLVQFANDECDYGEGLELGLQLFCYGHKTFHRVITHLLPLAYELLNRQVYANVIRAHLRHRQCVGCLDQLTK